MPPTSDDLKHQLNEYYLAIADVIGVISEDIITRVN